jgi:hypothetical protein
MKAIVHGTRAQPLGQQTGDHQGSHSAKFVIRSIYIWFVKNSGCIFDSVLFCVGSFGRSRELSAADAEGIIPGFA